MTVRYGRRIFGLFLVMAFAAGPAAGDIAERIKPVGNVCVEGEECGVAVAGAGGGEAAAAGSEDFWAFEGAALPSDLRTSKMFGKPSGWQR